MLENIWGHSRGSIPPLRMPSLLPHDLCHEWNVSRRLPALEFTQTRPLSQWCHPTISSSVVVFSSSLQSFPASGSFQMSLFFTVVAKGLSFSFSISPSNEYSGLISLGWSGWISLQSKGLSRVFSNTKVQKHQFFSVQPSLWSNSHIHTWYWKDHSFG